jgi:hypothetical protein
LTVGAAKSHYHGHIPASFHAKRPMTQGETWDYAMGRAPGTGPPPVKPKPMTAQERRDAQAVFQVKHYIGEVTDAHGQTFTVLESGNPKFYVFTPHSSPGVMSTMQIPVRKTDLKPEIRKALAHGMSYRQAPARRSGLGAEIELARAAVGGRHVKGTPYEWKHEWIPLGPHAALSHFHGHVPSWWKPGVARKPSGAGGTVKGVRGDRAKIPADVSAALGRARQAITDALGPEGPRNQYNRPLVEPGNRSVKETQAALDALASEAAKPDPDVQLLGKHLDDALTSARSYDGPGQLPQFNAAADDLRRAVIGHQVAVATRGLSPKARYLAVTEPEYMNPAGPGAHYNLRDRGTVGTVAQQAALRGQKVEELGGPPDLSGLPPNLRKLYEHAEAHGWNVAVSHSRDSSGQPIEKVQAVRPQGPGEPYLKAEQTYIGGKRFTYSAESVKASMQRITDNPRPLPDLQGALGPEPVSPGPGGAVSSWDKAGMSGWLHQTAARDAWLKARKAADLQKAGGSHQDIMGQLAGAEMSAPPDQRAAYARMLDEYAGGHGLKGWYRHDTPGPGGKHFVEVNKIRTPAEGDVGRYYSWRGQLGRPGDRPVYVIDRDTGKRVAEVADDQAAKAWIAKAEGGPEAKPSPELDAIASKVAAAEPRYRLGAAQAHVMGGHGGPPASAMSALISNLTHTDQAGAERMGREYAQDSPAGRAEQAAQLDKIMAVAQGTVAELPEGLVAKAGAYSAGIHQALGIPRAPVPVPRDVIPDAATKARIEAATARQRAALASTPLDMSEWERAWETAHGHPAPAGTRRRWAYSGLSAVEKESGWYAAGMEKKHGPGWEQNAAIAAGRQPRGALTESGKVAQPVQVARPQRLPKGKVVARQPLAFGAQKWGPIPGTKSWLMWGGPGDKMMFTSGVVWQEIRHPTASGTYQTVKEADAAAQAFVRTGLEQGKAESAKPLVDAAAKHGLAVTELGQGPHAEAGILSEPDAGGVQTAVLRVDRATGEIKATNGEVVQPDEVDDYLAMYKLHPDWLSGALLAGAKARIHSGQRPEKQAGALGALTEEHPTPTWGWGKMKDPASDAIVGKAVKAMKAHRYDVALKHLDEADALEAKAGVPAGEDSRGFIEHGRQMYTQFKAGHENALAQERMNAVSLAGRIRLKEATGLDLPIPVDLGLIAGRPDYDTASRLLVKGDYAGALAALDRAVVMERGNRKTGGNAKLNRYRDQVAKATVAPQTTLVPLTVVRRKNKTSLIASDHLGNEYHVTYENGTVTVTLDGRSLSAPSADAKGATNVARRLATELSGGDVAHAVTPPEPGAPRYSETGPRPGARWVVPPKAADKLGMAAGTDLRELKEALGRGDLAGAELMLERLEETYRTPGAFTGDGAAVAGKIAALRARVRKALDRAAKARVELAAMKGTKAALATTANRAASAALHDAPGPGGTPEGDRMQDNPSPGAGRSAAFR